MYVNKNTGWVAVQQMYIPSDISDETLGTAASQTDATLKGFCL